MIDYVYSDSLTYDFSGETITVVTDNGSDYVAFNSSHNTYKKIIDYLVSTGAGNVWRASMDTEFLRIYPTAGATLIQTITVSNAELAELLGFSNVNNTVFDLEYFTPTWGYKLPRTTAHELVPGLNGGFKERRPESMYRSRQTKITSNAVYSSPFIVRRAFVYTYRLDQKHVAWFDRLIAVFSTENLVATTDDMNVIEGTCVDQFSGEVEQVYETHNVMTNTITILGVKSGS